VKRSAQAAPPAKPQRILLDSSCWLEWLADTPRAEAFAPAFERMPDLVVPVVVMYEVTKKLRREVGDDIAWQALSLMQQGEVVDIDQPLAIDATGNGLPLADSLIYATARAKDAELWTQDAHFKGLPGVRYFEPG
jgi:predicted nucleic acid-binding protein